MIKITLTPRGLAIKQVLFQCLHFLCALFVFVLRVIFALLYFVLGSQAKKQHVPSNNKISKSKVDQQAEKTVLQNPPKQTSKNQNIVFEPTAFVIKIAPGEPYFSEKTKALKARGYRWHSDLNAWALPRVRLGNNHPDFNRIIAELKLAGYSWNGLCWTLYFPASKKSDHMRYVR